MTETKEQKILEGIRSKLEAEEPIRLKLPCDGNLVIDQPVPFLVIYRFPPNGKDNFTSRLGRTESSYIMGGDKPDCMLRSIVEMLAKQQADKFGAFLLLEVWVSEDHQTDDFKIHVHHKTATSLAEILKTQLSKMVVGVHRFTASIVKEPFIGPSYFDTLLPKELLKKSETLLLGLEIKPTYINESTGKPYPLFLREMRNAFSKTLKKVFFEFVRLHTSFNASHFEMLGKTVIEDLVWEIDTKLMEYGKQFDFLFLVTPVNTQEAWKTFSENDFQKPPVFHYRHMPIDPELIKRKLYDLPIEEISDPTIAFLFRDKRKEIDRMLNMLAEREKPDFVQSSIQLFGRIDEYLLDVAKALLVAIPAEKPSRKNDTISAEEFAVLAKKEFEYLEKQHEGVNCEINVRDDIEGILVSRGSLHISKNFSVDKKRIDALLQHEIGTHVVTYFNGKAQPFKLLSSGVPGYEQLQEGLAVLSEYIMKGFTNSRLRTLAARVLAVDLMVSGRSFVETFHLLVDRHHFTPAIAFSITTRVYRGGGLTKDAVYLKGLLNLLEYIKKGNEIEPLLIGKIRQDYLPIIEELIHRRLLKPIPIKPRFLSNPYKERLKNLTNGISIFNMTQQV